MTRRMISVDKCDINNNATTSCFCDAAQKDRSLSNKEAVRGITSKFIHAVLSRRKEQHTAKP